MKFIYFYNNESACTINNFDEYDLLENENNNYVSHSREVSKKTIYKESNNNKFIHIFKEHKNGYGISIYTHYASCCL